MMLVFPAAIPAQDLSPWFGNFLEFEPCLTYTHMHADRVNVGSKDKNHHLTSDLTTLSCGLVFDPSWDANVQVAGGKNKGGGFQFRKTGFSVRHLFSKDIWAGSVSCSGGASLMISSQSQLKDLLQVQKSTVEGSVHAAIGHEHIFSKKRFSHVWAAATIGVGGHACTWIDGEMHADMILGNEDDSAHRLGLFVKASQGFGRHSLKLHSSHPYQAVHYHYADGGLSYYYTYCSLGSVSLEMTRRLTARNCPKDVFGCKLTFTIPFSL